jgi:hypothetical protein
MEQALTLSDEAYEQATIYELGKPVSEYPSQADTEKMKKGMSVIRLAFFLAWILITALYCCCIKFSFISKLCLS